MLTGPLGIIVKFDDKIFVMVNVYTPCESHANEDLYLERLSYLSVYLNELETTCVYILVT